MPYVDFMAIKAAVSIEDTANLLKLTLKKSGNKLRSNCPACGNEDERIVVITPSRGLFYCFDAKVGGDCLALVQHITGLDVKTRPLSCPLPGLLTIPLPPAEESGCDQKGNCLRPGRIRVEAPIHRTGGAAGLYGGGGERLLYRLLPGQVYIPIRHSDGSIGGFVGYADGQMKLPPKWLLATSNMVTFSKKSA
jgi:hypothetical protein